VDSGRLHLAEELEGSEKNITPSPEWGNVRFCKEAWAPGGRGGQENADEEKKEGEEGEEQTPIDPP